MGEDVEGLGEFDCEDEDENGRHKADAANSKSWSDCCNESKMITWILVINLLLGAKLDGDLMQHPSDAWISWLEGFN